MKRLAALAAVLALVGCGPPPPTLLPPPRVPVVTPIKVIVTTKNCRIAGVTTYEVLNIPAPGWYSYADANTGLVQTAPVYVPAKGYGITFTGPPARLPFYIVFKTEAGTAGVWKRVSDNVTAPAGICV